MSEQKFDARIMAEEWREAHLVHRKLLPAIEQLISEIYAAGRAAAPAAGQLCEEQIFDLVQSTREKLEPFLVREVYKTGTMPVIRLTVDTILQQAFETALLRQPASSEAAKSR